MNGTSGGSMLANLYSYEIVLLALGVLLFLVGLWALVRCVRKSSVANGGIGVTCALISLLFIGYPSLRSFSIKNEFLQLEAQFADGKTPNLSTQQQQDVLATIETLAPRASTPEQNAVIANAYRGVGAVDKAYAIAEKVDASDPPPAVKSALAPVFAAKLRQAVEDVPVTPGAAVDSGRAAQIESLVKKLDVPAAELPAPTRVTIAKGYVVLGKEASAEANIAKAQAIKPDVRVDPRLLERLNRAPALDD